MSKRIPTNGTNVGNGALTFDPRKKFVKRKIKKIEYRVGQQV